MNWKTNSIFLVLLFWLFGCSESPENSFQKSEHSKLDYASIRYLIEVEELRRELKAGAKFKLIDVRKPEEFKAGHIGNALNIWRDQITDTLYPYGGMMATKTQLETLLGSLGVSTDDTLIIYDNKAECNAARLWWILKFYGHQNMKLLNGGLKAWLELDSNLVTSKTEVSPVEYQFNSQADSSIYASVQLVGSVMADTTWQLLDTRGIPEFTGEKLKNGAAWPGHISGALNLDWAEAVDYNGNHKFLSADELKSKYEKLNISDDWSVIVYCHSGVRSAHTLFVLTELLGYENVRNYDGSWTEWSHLNPESE